MENSRYCYRYPHPAVTADCVVISKGEQNEPHLLLIKRGNEPFKDCWAFPGGFINPDETMEEGCIRELREETGISAGNIMQTGAYSDPHRDPRERIITVAFLTFMEKMEAKGGDDAAEARWFPFSSLPQLAFDHELILKNTLKTIKKEISLPESLRDVIFHKLDKEMIDRLSSL